MYVLKGSCVVYQSEYDFSMKQYAYTKETTEYNIMDNRDFHWLR